MLVIYVPLIPKHPPVACADRRIKFLFDSNMMEEVSESYKFCTFLSNFVLSIMMFHYRWTTFYLFGSIHYTERCDIQNFQW